MRNPKYVLLATVVALSAIAGCGGGSDGSSTAKNETRGAAPPQGEVAKAPDHEHGHEGEMAPPDTSASETGEAPGDGSIQAYGEEGRTSQRERFGQLLERYLRARASRHWQQACSYLTAGLQRQYGQAGGAGCAKTMEILGSRVPADLLREEADIEPLRLRVDQGAYLLVYRGTGGVVYTMPFQREGTRWRLALVAPAALE